MAGPAFYGFMNRLIKDGWVNHRLNEELVRDLAVKETFYSLTKPGRAEYRRTVEFYLARSKTPEAQGSKAPRRPALSKG